MREIVHAVVTVQGGDRELTPLARGEVAGVVHDALADSLDLQRLYGRTGYTVIVEIVVDS